MVLIYLNAFDLKNIANNWEPTKLYVQWSPKSETALKIWEPKNRKKISFAIVKSFRIILAIVVLQFWTPNYCICILCILCSQVYPNYVPVTRGSLRGKDQCCKPKYLSFICRTTEESGAQMGFFNWGGSSCQQMISTQLVILRNVGFN